MMAEQDNVDSFDTGVFSQRQKNRAKDYAVGSAVGAVSAIASVYVSRKVTPESMQKLGNAWEGYFARKNPHDSAGFVAQEGRRAANWTVMLGTGFVTNIGTQLTKTLSRKDEEERSRWPVHLARVTTGWCGGFVGASVAVAASDYFFRHDSKHMIKPWKTQIENGLDRVINYVRGAEKGALEILDGNKLSEVFLDNAIMTAGAIPTGLVTQTIYDKAIKADYNPDVSR